MATEPVMPMYPAVFHRHDLRVKAVLPLTGRRTACWFGNTIHKTSVKEAPDSRRDKAVVWRKGRRVNMVIRCGKGKYPILYLLSHFGIN